MSNRRACDAPGTLRMIAAATLILMVTGPLAAEQSTEPSSSQVQVPNSGTPAASTTAQEGSVPTLSTNVDEVSLDLVVRTKGGKPILNLIPGDLAITDNGVPVKLSDLHLVKGTSESQRLITVVFDRLDPGPAKTARAVAAKILAVIPQTGYSYAVLQMNGRL
jgi:hypothetical protein